MWWKSFCKCRPTGERPGKSIHEEPRQPSFGLLVAEPDESLGAMGRVDAPAILLGGGFDLVEPRFKRTNLQALETSILEPLQDLGRLPASRLALEDEPE